MSGNLLGTFNARPISTCVLEKKEVKNKNCA